MGTVNNNTCEVLNDLVRINNDRIDGYNKACEESKDNAPELGNIFLDMIGQSRTNISELSNLVTKYGGAVATGTTAMGKVYRTWMDIQITFSVNDRKHILNACEFGEDAAQKAYRTALEEVELGEEARSLIAKQKNSLKDSHDLIRSMRDREREKAHA